VREASKQRILFPKNAKEIEHSPLERKLEQKNVPSRACAGIRKEQPPLPTTHRKRKIMQSRISRSMHTASGGIIC